MFFSIFTAAACLFVIETAFAKARVVEKDFDNDGKIDQIAHFDPKGKISKLEIDGNKDGIMDRFQFYRDGKLIRVEKDTNNDQTIDSRDYFKQGKRIRAPSENKKRYRKRRSLRHPLSL